MSAELLAENQCPRCGHMIPNDVTPGEYPGALSRYDDETYVCSSCGQDEAMLQWGTKDKTLEEDHKNWYVFMVRAIIDADTPAKARDVILGYWRHGN